MTHFALPSPFVEYSVAPYCPTSKTSSEVWPHYFNSNRPVWRGMVHFLCFISAICPAHDFVSEKKKKNVDVGILGSLSCPTNGQKPVKAEQTMASTTPVQSCTLRSDTMSSTGLGWTSTSLKGRPSGRLACVTLDISIDIRRVGGGVGKERAGRNGA